jgi:hypothetical protein
MFETQTQERGHTQTHTHTNKHTHTHTSQQNAHAHHTYTTTHTHTHRHKQKHKNTHTHSHLHTHTHTSLKGEEHFGAATVTKVSPQDLLGAAGGQQNAGAVWLEVDLQQHLGRVEEHVVGSGCGDVLCREHAVERAGDNPAVACLRNKLRREERVHEQTKPFSIPTLLPVSLAASLLLPPPLFPSLLSPPLPDLGAEDVSGVAGADALRLRFEVPPDADMQVVAAADQRRPCAVPADAVDAS